MRTTCALCGAVFPQSGLGRPRKYCPGCTPRRQLGYRSPSYGGKRKGNPPERQCSVCKVSFQPAQWTQHLCSVACRNRRHRSWGKRRAAMESRALRKPCAYCGQSFPVVAKLRSTFCSYQCKGAFVTATTIGANCEWRCGPKSCLRCDQGHFRRSIYCSGECRRIARYKYQPVAKHRKQCVVCETTFLGHGGALYCSTSCRRDSTPARNGRRRAKVKRRALTSGGGVSRHAVFERDNWTCRICGMAVLRTARVPAPYAPTLDHIIPLARGGSHEPSNVQCAHFICNSRKADSLPLAV